MNSFFQKVCYLWLTAIAIAAVTPTPAHALNFRHWFKEPSGNYWFCDIRTQKHLRTYLIRAYSPEHARHIAPSEMGIKNSKWVHCY